MTQHNFGDQVSFIIWPVLGGDRREIATGEFRGYAGVTSMMVLWNGYMRFVPVSNEIDPNARCVCGYFGSAHINGFASTNQPDGACPWRFAVDSIDAQVYAWFEVATQLCRHGSLIYFGSYCQACDAGDDEPEPEVETRAEHRLFREGRNASEAAR